MRIIYNHATLQVSAIEFDVQSMTAFGPDYAAIQADPETVINVAIAVGLDTTQIINFAKENNIILPMTPELEKTLKDRAFCTGLLNEFTAQQQQTSVDAATYKVMIGVFQYVLFALQMGNVLQAKMQLLEISPIDYQPVWTQADQDYYVGKINTYLGL